MHSKEAIEQYFPVVLLAVCRFSTFEFVDKNLNL